MKRKGRGMAPAGMVERAGGGAPCLLPLPVEKKKGKARGRSPLPVEKEEEEGSAGAAGHLPAFRRTNGRKEGGGVLTWAVEGKEVAVKGGLAGGSGAVKGGWPASAKRETRDRVGGRESRDRGERDER